MWLEKSETEHAFKLKYISLEVDEATGTKLGCLGYRSKPWHEADFTCRK